jgi:ribosome-binding factor A
VLQFGKGGPAAVSPFAAAGDRSAQQGQSRIPEQSGEQAGSMKHRLERVNEVLKRELSEIISREINFAPQVLVTIPAVAISSDLRQCNVFVSVIGQEAQKTRVLEQLEEHRSIMQRELSKRVVLKYTPHLYFKLDDSIERGSRVLKIIQDLDEPPADQ